MNFDHDWFNRYIEGIVDEGQATFRPMFTAADIAKMKMDLSPEPLRMVTSKYLDPGTILLVPEGPMPFCLTEEEVSAYWKRCCILRVSPDAATLPSEDRPCRR